MNRLTILFGIALIASCNAKTTSTEEAQPEIKLGKAEYVCKLKKPTEKNRGTQGFDIFGDYMVNCRNLGYAFVYKFDGETATYLGDFPLASCDSNNHANVASFGRTFYKKNDPLPLLYVSQAAKQTYKGYKDVLFVERIAPDFKSSELVQTIYFDDVNKDFGYALQWVVDETGKFLYGYGNTTKDRDIEGNRHRIAKFNMPSLEDSNAEGMVILKPDDMLENYTIEDYGYKFATIGQGLFVWKDRLYMPVGAGSEEYPAFLYVWNLRTKKMEVAEDLNYSGMGEPEDMSRFRSKFIISSVNGLYQIDI